jgi:hypothetical protein
MLFGRVVPFALVTRGLKGSPVCSGRAPQFGMAAGGSAVKKRYFVKVRDGGAVGYYLDDESIVSDLLKQVKIVEELTVGVGKLELYTSDTKETARTSCCPICESCSDSLCLSVLHAVHCVCFGDRLCTDCLSLRVCCCCPKSVARTLVTTLSAE